MKLSVEAVPATRVRPKPTPRAVPPPPPAGAERRAAPRHFLRADITVRSQDNLVVTWTEDLSVGGVFASTSSPPDIGEIVQVEITVAGSLPLRVLGEVRWHRVDEDGLPTGCGLAFRDLPDAARTRLAGWLETLPQAPLLGG